MIVPSVFSNVYLTYLHFTFCIYPTFHNRIGGVMVSVFASSAVDRGLEPRSGQTEDYKISICCFSAKHAALRKKKNGWLGIRIICPSGATCLPMDCCFSELPLSKINSAC